MLAPELLRNRVSPRPRPGRRNLTHEATEAPQALFVPPGHNRKSFYWLSPSDRRISVLWLPGKNLLAAPRSVAGGYQLLITPASWAAPPAPGPSPRRLRVQADDYTPMRNATGSCCTA